MPDVVKNPVINLMRQRPILTAFPTSSTASRRLRTGTSIWRVLTRNSVTPRRPRVCFRKRTQLMKRIQATDDVETQVRSVRAPLAEIRSHDQGRGGVQIVAAR